MNKKGIFIWGITLVTMFLVVILLLAFSNSESRNNRSILGEVQGMVIKTYSESEGALLYIDLASKYVAEISYINLINSNGCNKYDGYSLWLLGSKRCFPDFHKEFNSTFNEELNRFLENYRELEIPRDNYEIEIKDGFIKGRSINQLFTVKENIEYSVYPDFKIKSEISLDSLDRISKQAEEIYNKCGQEDKCWKQKIPKEWKMEILEDGKVFIFVADENNEELKFALNFNPILT